MSPRITPFLLPVASAVLGLAAHALCQTAAPDWTTLVTSNTPSSRFDQGVCYFENRDGVGRILMQGGTVGATTVTETWSLNTLTGAWTNLNPAVAPSARWDIAMAFDRNRNRVVLFGGQFGTTLFNDTWEFDGTTWAQLSPTTSPGVRRFHAMAYDNARGVVVLFGGENLTGTRFNDTWEWNGANWTQRTPTTTPAVRSQHAMCFDLVRGVTVMTGGSPTTTETWEWNGTNWTQRANMIAGNFNHAFTFDAARQRCVLLDSIFGTPNTYEWDGTSWAQITTTNIPAAGALGQYMAYDENRGVSVYVHGGFAGTSLYGSPTPAAFLGYGTGCTGTGGYLPRLRGQTAMEVPWIGTTLDLLGIGSFPGGQSVFLRVGSSDTMWGGNPLPFDLTPLGAPGCFVWGSDEAGTITGTTTIFGLIAFPIVIPNNPATVGQSFFFQFGVFDATANSLGVVASAGRRAILGT